MDSEAVECFIRAGGDSYLGSMRREWERYDYQILIEGFGRRGRGELGSSISAYLATVESDMPRL